MLNLILNLIFWVAHPFGLCKGGALLRHNHERQPRGSRVQDISLQVAKAKATALPLSKPQMWATRKFKGGDFYLWLQPGLKLRLPTL
jgi:hypothetical protein